MKLVISGPAATVALQGRLSALERSTRGHRARDVLWATGSRIGTQGLQFIAVVVLARLLTPSAFGVVAVAQVFVGFANIFSDLGLGATVVRARELTAEHVSTAFYLNLVLGFALAGVVVALAPLLAAAYGQPLLLPILAIAGCQSAFNVTVVPLALLERAFRFRLIAFIEVSCAVLAASISITFASIGVGPESLVAGPFASIVIEGAVLFSIVRPPVLGSWSREAAREIWKYSGPIVAFSSLNYWARNVDNLVLGIVAGTRSLGLYSRAYSLMLVPVQQVNVVLGRVLLPSLSRQPSHLHMRRVYLKALRLSSVVTVPLGIGISCLAGSLSEVLFGPAWHGLAPILALLACTTPVQVIVTTTGPIYQATGETRAWSRRSGVGSIVTMIGLTVGALFGAIGVATGWALCCYGTAVYLLRQPWGLLDLSLSAGLKSLIPQFVAALTMGAWLVTYDVICHFPAFLQLLAGVSSGTIVYAVVLYLLDAALLRAFVSAFALKVGSSVVGGAEANVTTSSMPATGPAAARSEAPAQGGRSR